MALDKKLLAILVCPLCKGELQYRSEADELWCKFDGLAYPIIDDIPVMLDSEARQLTADEKLGS
ncbi:MAG: Trm112 family protein [Pseudomonadales bacterium]|nr:Trm112 family protein [Pseudomonadales bacterium]MDG1443517.1 Trm112 family protein [Pseudomonadales bacterium]